MRLIAPLCILLAAAPSFADGPLATVGSRSITQAEVEAQVRPQLLELEQQRYDILKAGVDGIIDKELVTQEAAARGISVAELMTQEVQNKAEAPPEGLVNQLYEANKEQIGQPFEEVKAQLEEYVQQAGVEARQGEFLQELRGKYKVAVHLEPPTVEVANGERPARGPANAPITIVAFSDYECPFCKRGEETLEQVIETYGDKVKVFHRDYPLSFHANAHAAAQAAHCANDQSKFWEYHTKLFEASDLTATGLASIAKDLALDEGKFSECLSSGKYKAAVDKEMADGNAAGVNGTPAFFINGRSLSGAQPFEAFKEIIDAELARIGQTG